MMTEQLQVSIITAQIAALDRRALSQAWYSALGFTAQRPRSCPQSSRAREVAERCTLQPYAMPRREHPCVWPTASRQAGRIASRAIADDETIEPGRRPAPHAALARRIERALLTTQPLPKRSTFSLGRGSARIHIIVQTKGSVTTLLALCSPELRPIVARALARARFVLAAGGIGIAQSSIGV